jgi:hypothetical protein
MWWFADVVFFPATTPKAAIYVQASNQDTAKTINKQLMYLYVAIFLFFGGGFGWTTKEAPVQLTLL